NCIPGVLTMLHEQGCGAEVASPYEFWMASQLGVAPAAIIDNVVNRSVEDFERAIHYGVGLINIDSITAARHLAAASARIGRPVDAGIRMDTGVGWKAHFGVQARSRELRELASELGRPRWVRVRAVHCH